jgi:hypothetical protein
MSIVSYKATGPLTDDLVGGPSPWRSTRSRRGSTISNRYICALSRQPAELAQACCRTCRRRRVGPSQIRGRGALGAACAGGNAAADHRPDRPGIVGDRSAPKSQCCNPFPCCFNGLQFLPAIPCDTDAKRTYRRLVAFPDRPACAPSNCSPATSRTASRLNRWPSSCGSGLQATERVVAGARKVRGRAKCGRSRRQDGRCSTRRSHDGQKEPRIFEWRVMLPEAQAQIYIDDTSPNCSASHAALS